MFLQRLVWFVFLVLLQVLVLNHVHILGYATPMLYIYYILVLNAEIPRKSLLLQAFSWDYASISSVILQA